MKLYTLVSQYKTVQSMAEEVDEITLIETLESIEDAIEVKAENIAKMIKEMESEAEIIKLEEKRLAERRRAMERKAASLKTYLQDQLEALGIDKIKSPLITITIRNNPPSVNITNEFLIPAKYFIPQPSIISKKDISEALKNGEVIEGAELVRKRGLQIK